jgi:hypothetical protein
MRIYTFDISQYIFDRFLLALLITARLFIKAIVYLPLWFSGYAITNRLLVKEDSGFAWIGLILLIAFALYQLVFFFKGIIIGLKSRGNLLWITFFILCAVFTCIVPSWIIFENLHSLAFRLSHQAGDVLTWLFAISFGLYVYSRYHFLINIAPVAAYPVYQMGIDISLKMMNSTTSLPAAKSRQII